MNDIDFDDDEQPDQTVNIGYTVPPLPDDHWSLRAEWRKYKAGLTETAPTPSTTEVSTEWREFAHALSGAKEPEEIA